jgi:hypothetical protein
LIRLPIFQMQMHETHITREMDNIRLEVRKGSTVFSFAHIFVCWKGRSESLRQ